MADEEQRENQKRPGEASIPMLLWCPICRGRHIDRGEFATKPHHTHACQECGHVWRPAIVATRGVQFLPGFKNELDLKRRPIPYRCSRCGRVAWSGPLPTDPDALRVYALPEGWDLVDSPPGQDSDVWCGDCLLRGHELGMLGEKPEPVEQHRSRCATLHGEPCDCGRG